MANLQADSKLIFTDDSSGGLILQDFTNSDERELHFECTGTLDFVCNRASTGEDKIFNFSLRFPYSTLAGEIRSGGHLVLQGDAVLLGTSARVRFDTGTASTVWSLASDTNQRKLRFLIGDNERIVLDADQIDFYQYTAKFSGARMTISGTDARAQTQVYTGSGGPSSPTAGQLVLRSNESGKALLCYDGSAWKKVDLVAA